ncbi:MAG TPA: 2-oxoacid:acceptor oxidoreductase family protein [Solirubrobacterales bacterium]|jgi:pyruvate ferredoxin oxidoreductase gamma subunit
MFEVRVHGRGGQGVVTAAELLSVAAFEEGLHAQAFPSFGSERSGAPVVAYCRLADSPIRTREPVAEPDALIVQDPTLLHQVDLFNGLGPDAHILINSSRSLADLGLAEFAEGFRPERLMTVPATDIARRRLGRPLPNAALVGGFAALTGRLGLEAVVTAICERFPGVLGERNAAAARETFGLVESESREAAGA